MCKTEKPEKHRQLLDSVIIVQISLHIPQKIVGTHLNKMDIPELSNRVPSEFYNLLKLIRIS